MEENCLSQKVWTGIGGVAENVQLAERTFRIAVNVQEPLPPIVAGQFAMLRLPGRSDPLLGRPLAVYRITPTAAGNLVEFVYLVVGKMTTRLSELKPGDSLEVWAPLGNGFEASDVDHLIMVAGGIGQTPFLMLAKELEGTCRRTMLYGARNAGRVACMGDFEKLGVDVHVATDDGSHGYHGPVTRLIEKVHRPGERTRIFCCGPHPMLQAAYHVARKLDLRCHVSLESPMSCGLGICFGCVIKYKNSWDDETWDYRRTCVDGPVFDAYRLVWE